MKFLTIVTRRIGLYCAKPRVQWSFILSIIFLLSPAETKGQVLFMEDCFVGGVFTSGVDNTGFQQGVKAGIKWDVDHSVRSLHAITYRYGRPAPFTFFINGAGYAFGPGSQVGPELIETNPLTEYFAVHAVDITNDVFIAADSLLFVMPNQPFDGNKGWWGIYVIATYTAPSITEEVCLKVYIADQNQMWPQNYLVERPDFDDAHPLVFAVHSGRMAPGFFDASEVRLNNHHIGNFWGPDLLSPPPFSGTHGHYYFENEACHGLNGDTCNTTVNHHDGVAVINEYIPSNPGAFPLRIGRIEFDPFGGANPHPSFNLTYTPSCPVTSSDAMPRRYTLCRGESVELQGVEGFDHYEWSTALQLSDSTLMNPTCTPDSSRWYRLRMWNEDAAQGCPLTIPVWVEVGDIPRPPKPSVVASSCPANTGRIRLEDTPGKAPHLYTVGEQSSEVFIFNGLAPGSYPVSITDALGCTWDTTLTVPLNTPHSAAFSANPTEGTSPLSVIFSNQSSGSASFTWLMDGESFSNNRNAMYIFPDSGYFEVSLIAVRDNEACADTATVMIRVEPGIQVIMPNIFTPNGDGRNDRLVATLTGVAKAEWAVYNRWGNLLHSGSTAALEHGSALVIWDGMAPGGPAPDGSYVLHFSATGLRGKVEQMHFGVELRGSRGR